MTHVLIAENRSGRFTVYDLNQAGEVHDHVAFAIQKWHALFDEEYVRQYLNIHWAYVSFRKKAWKV